MVFQVYSSALLHHYFSPLGTLCRTLISSLLTAYNKTWPGPIGLAWPQSRPGLNVGTKVGPKQTFGPKIGPKQNFGLASKVDLASKLAQNIWPQNLKCVFFFELQIYVIYSVIDNLQNITSQHMPQSIQEHETPGTDQFS